MSFPVRCGLCAALTDRTVTVMLHRDEIPAHLVHKYTFDTCCWVERRQLWNQDTFTYDICDVTVRSKNTSICPACQKNT
jgi:hypothetical protein